MKALSMLSYRGPNLAPDGTVIAGGGVASALSNIREIEGAGWYYFIGNLFCFLSQYAVAPIILGTLDEAIVNGHYLYCNKVLWPLAHRKFEKVDYVEEEHAAYVALQKWVAEKINNHNPEQVVFVHDYQFYLIPGLLKQTMFFLHTPFPGSAPDVYAASVREITKGVIQALIIGFHIPLYRAEFMEFCASEILGLSVDRDEKCITSLSTGRTTDLIVAPLGVDREFWQQHAQSAIATAERRKDGKRRFLLVCRADYTKAVPELLMAWLLFHKHHPDEARSSVLTMIVTASRTVIPAFNDELRRIQNAYDQLISYLISEVGEEAAHDMVRWIKEAVSPAELGVIYAENDCLLAPPWLDGLNLTIFEFIMTQLSLNGGVVAVSLLTGARAVLRGVIDLTPGDVSRMAIAIKNCFDDIGTRRAQGRMQVMINSVPSLAQWWQDFKALAL